MNTIPNSADQPTKLVFTALSTINDNELAKANIINDVNTVYDAVQISESEGISSKSLLVDRQQELSWDDIEKVRLPCGNKHDELVKVEEAIAGTGARVPRYFGFTHEQIQGLFSEQTMLLWKEIHLKGSQDCNAILSNREGQDLLSKLRHSIGNDLSSSTNLFDPTQKKLIKALANKKIIVRSSSNEDGEVVNAGGNKSIAGITASERNIQCFLVMVVKSYFSLQSLKNRSAFENPFLQVPLCGVLIMEQITEDDDKLLPIVSGVMMTDKIAWRCSEEDPITHITAAWGFGNGTSNKTACDEWIITEDQIYPSIHHKLYRIKPRPGYEDKVANLANLKETPSLSDKQLKQLKDIAHKLELHFEEPRNVEFVFKGDDLYIVQARRIKAAPISNPTYLNQTKIPNLLQLHQGKMVVKGSNQVISLAHRDLFFRDNLENAEKEFNSNKHKAVVVYTDEKSTTHPAVNFDNYRPPIPCLVLPYDTWKKCKHYDNRSFKYQLCEQSATLVETNQPLPVCDGLMIHPANFPITVSNTGHSIQGESRHASIQKLQKLLMSTPEILQNHLVDIDKTLRGLILEIYSRKAMMHGQFFEITQNLKIAALDCIQKMTIAAEKQHLTRLAFHAGILRQLVGQSEQQVIGSHSISGLEVATKLGECIEEFIKINENSSILCELAMLGQQGFDEPTQRKWLEFLSTNRDNPLLESLYKNLQELDILGTTTQWFSTYFSYTELPELEILLDEFESLETNTKLLHFSVEFKELATALKRANSVQDLEKVWAKLEHQSNQFLSFITEHHMKHPLLLDLIDLWDLSTKAVRTSKLFGEEQRTFKERVNAFMSFAEKASRTDSLDYGLGNVIYQMGTLGKSHTPFSVQHWMHPISHGALAKIETDDQRLTVLHQNLLQAAAYGDIHQLPTQLAKAYKIFIKNLKCEAKRNGMETGTFISISKEEISVRINIPLNFHSSVVTLSQKKEDDKIKVTLYLRGSDNYQGKHHDFFKLFSSFYGIPLIDSQEHETDLKVVFLLDTGKGFKLLSRAINSVNGMSIYSVNHIDFFLSLYKEENKKAILDKLSGRLWDYFKVSGKFLNIIGYDQYDMIWDYLKAHDMNSEMELITTRVIKEIIGELPSTFFRLDFRHVLKTLPFEKFKEVLWVDLMKEKFISRYYIPKEYQVKIDTALFKEHPERVLSFVDKDLRLIIDLMNSKLEAGVLESREEAHLLFHLALKYKGNIPEKWIEALRGWASEDIDAFINEGKSKYKAQFQNRSIQVNSTNPFQRLCSALGKGGTAS